MEMFKYALQATVVGNKIQTFLMIRAATRYGKRHGTMASVSDLLQVTP